MSTNKIFLYKNINNNVCEITLNNPSKRNPLSLELIVSLQVLLNNLKKSKTIKVILLRSTGPSFCSGHDLKEVQSFSSSKAKLLNLFKKLNSDLVIVMGYGLLIPEIFLEDPTFGFINIHLSLLPRWRGAAPVEYTLMYGDKKAGVSIFKLNKNLDQGPILNKKEVEISDSINKIELQQKLNKAGVDLLLETLEKYFSNKISLQSQKEEHVTYAPKIKTNHRKIDFNKNARDVFNKVRSFSPNPGAWFLLNKERLKIISCKLEKLNGEPSTILSKNLIVACKDYSIQPLIIQREGKKSMNINEFLRGFSFKIGDKINEN